MLRAAIIDDEAHSIKTLTYLLKRDFPQVETVLTSMDPVAAKPQLEQYLPDIVFLDIEMAGIDELQFLTQFDPIPFKVVFTTAYDQYAIRAIQLNALDYLLKPVTREDLQRAVDRYLQATENTSKEKVLQLHLFAQRKIPETIALSSNQGLYFVKLEDILYLEGDDCYTHVVLRNDPKCVVSKTLSVFEELLGSEGPFPRAHKSYIINLYFTRQYIRGEGGEIIMQDGKRIALSRNKKEEFLGLFKKI
jgi:two-component system LytT family response regulator